MRATRAASHEVYYVNAGSDGMAFSLSNWRYWVFAVACILALCGIVMAILTAPPVEYKDDVRRIAYMFGAGIGGLICVGVVPGGFLLGAALSSAERTRRGLFTTSAIVALCLAFLYTVGAGFNLAVLGTAGSRALREEAYKQAFKTIDSYVEPTNKAVDAFVQAGGDNPKSLIGADTISQRIGMANKLKTTNAEAVRLLEAAEPTLDAWFESAGVSYSARQAFWVDRHGREYLSALRDARKVEARLSTAIIEYLYVMRNQADRFSVATDGTILFQDQDKIDAFRAARAKVVPLLNELDSCNAAAMRVAKQINSEAKK